MTNTKKPGQATKKNLKTMQKGHKKNHMREKARIVKYGTKGFGRNIWLSTAATAVMAITLIILFTTVVASVILTSTAEMIKNKIDITIYFKPETSKEELIDLAKIMQSSDNVKSVETSTAEEEYQKFTEENEESEAVVNVLDEDMQEIMIGKMHATMRIKVYDTNKIDDIKNIAENDELFTTYLDEREATYDVNRTEIDTINHWARIARTGGIILAVVFLVISILIIFSTIRMAIFSRREEIYMMKLIGADKGFIRGPFLVEAEICGIISGIVAAVLSYLGFKFMSPRLESYGIDVGTINEILNSNQLILVFLSFIVAGIIIGRISARLAISRYLKRM